MVLVDATGELRPTNVIEDVQIRVHRTIPRSIPQGLDLDNIEAHAAMDVFEFKLTRTKLFAHKDGGLRSLTRTDTEFPLFRSHDIDLFEENFNNRC
jgi:succinylglutamate desuccinylase